MVGSAGPFVKGHRKCQDLSAAPRGGGATGAGQRAGSSVVMTDPVPTPVIRRRFDSRGDGSPWRVRRAVACGSCCPGCSRYGIGGGAGRGARRPCRRSLVSAGRQPCIRPVQGAGGPLRRPRRSGRCRVPPVSCRALQTPPTGSLRMSPARTNRASARCAARLRWAALDEAWAARTPVGVVTSTPEPAISFQCTGRRHESFGHSRYLLVLDRELSSVFLLAGKEAHCAHAR